MMADITMSRITNESLPADLRRLSRTVINLTVGQVMHLAAEEIERWRAGRPVSEIGVVAALDAADPLRQPVSGDRVEAAFLSLERIFCGYTELTAVELRGQLLDDCIGAIKTLRAADRFESAVVCRQDASAEAPFDPVHSPGHTDLMVSPEALDEWLEKNPPPDDAVWTREMQGAIETRINNFRELLLSFTVNFRGKGHPDYAEWIKLLGEPFTFSPAAPWPQGCHHPNLCGTKGACQSIGCGHENIEFPL